MDNNSLMLIDNNGSFEIDDQSHMDVDASHNTAMTLFTPTKPNEDGPNPDTDDGLLTGPGTLPGKRRRKKSMVWEHFTIETASPGSTKACCKHCKKSFAYITGQKLAGTSHLKRHIQLGICPMSRENNQLAQIVESKDPTTCPPKKRQRSSATYMNVPLDQDRCYNEMAKMIIMHEYPLHMVEHPGFTGFVQALRPQFSMASFNTIHGDCVNMYLSEKQKLSNFINEIPGRVNLTIELWTSNQSVGYAFVTGHFIDRDWNLTQRLLNVAVVPSPDSDFALNQPIAACLSDWNLERRLSSLTVGRSVVNKSSIENLRCCLSVRDQHVLSGQLLLDNCYARLLSSMAQDLLGAEDLETPIKKVRDSVKYVKTKDSCGERFDELKKQLQTPCSKDLIIDNQTKWDTSYNMLLAACEHKEVFSCLGNYDLDYKMSISPEEWRKIEILCSSLKILFDAAKVLTGPTRLTANDLYHEMTKLQLELSHAAMSEDPDVRNLANPLKEKFDEYWRGCFLLLAVAVVMDPRFKMKLIEFSFFKAYGDDADKWTRSVDDAVHDLYHDYAEQNHSLLDAYVGHGNDGFSETDMSQVHFHHDMPHEYHHSNGLSHDQIYEQPEDGNRLNEKPRDHVIDSHESQEVGQTEVNQLAVESLHRAQEEKIAEPPLQEDESGGMGPQENQLMEGLSGEDQQTGTVSDGDNATQGVEPEGHLVDAGTQENHIEEGLSEERTMEGLTQESLLTEENLQSNGDPTLALERQLTDQISNESQSMETHNETQSAEEMDHEKLVEEFSCESQPSNDISVQIQPVEETSKDGRPVEDTDTTQNSLPGDGNVSETQPLEETVEDTQPVEEVAQEEIPQLSQPTEDIPPESHHIEEKPLENHQVDDKDITQDMQPVEEMLEDTQPDEELAQEAQQVEKHDDIQPVEEVGHETQPAEEMLEDTQPVEEVAQETQLVEDDHVDNKPVEEAGHETQAVEGLLEDTQPVEEVVQEEAQPTEQIPEHSQDPQNADGILRQEYPREDEAVQQEQQSDEGIASGQHPQSHGMPQEEGQHDSQSHEMPQENAAFAISQEGHHVDVLLQEGHHLEASSQEFPLITIGDGFSDFELYISEVGSHQQMKSELDQYLEESLIPRSQEFEVLGWWSLNRTKYPTLSKMAADVLSLPFCTVSPDSVFDTEVKRMDNYRSSLRHVTLEALFCAKDWFKHGSSSSTSENNLKRES